MNITLPDNLRNKIQDVMKDMNTNIDDFVREAVEARLEEELYLREKIREGLESGVSEPMEDVETLKREAREWKMELAPHASL